MSARQTKSEKRRFVAIHLVCARRWLLRHAEHGFYLTPEGVKILLNDLTEALEIVDIGGKVQALLAENAETKASERAP